jgi:hypothetical protein
MHITRISGALFVAFLSFATLAGEVSPLTLGDKLDFTALADQNDNVFHHQSDMKLLLFVRGMAAKDVAKDALAAIDKGCLTAGRVVYVADISQMPKMIANMMAIPKMRKYGYPVWLDRDGKSTQALPVAEDAVSVIAVEGGKIGNIDYVKDAAALAQRLSPECAAGR